MRQCLASIDANADVPYEIIVVDNASIDGAREMIRDYRPTNPLCARYVPILNDRNVGYATAANQGIKTKTAPYLLLLNQDTTIPARALSTLARVAQSHPGTGIVGVKLENEDGTLQQSVSDLPTIRQQLGRRLGLKSAAAIAHRQFDHSKEAEVQAIKGAVMLITPAAIEKVGLWDEKFFLWFEETDYCLRARAAGLSVRYTPEVVVRHVGQSAFVKVSWWKRQVIWNKSIRHYFGKHEGFFAGMFIGVLDPVCMVIGMVRERFTVRRN